MDPPDVLTESDLKMGGTILLLEDKFDELFKTPEAEKPAEKPGKQGKAEEKKKEEVKVEIVAERIKDRIRRLAGFTENSRVAALSPTATTTASLIFGCRRIAASTCPA